MLRDVIRRLVTDDPLIYHVFFTFDNKRFVIWAELGGMFLKRRIKSYFTKRMGGPVTNISIVLSDGHPTNLPDYMVIQGI